MTKLSLIIPCHNEAEAIPTVMAAIELAVSRVLAKGLISSCEVIVVNDASADDTASLLRQYSWLKTVEISSRSGYGAALKVGFGLASGDWLAFFDLDGSYDPDDLDALLESFARAEFEFFLGERLSAGLGMPLTRSVGNRFFTSLVRLLYRRQVSDVCTGFRIFHRRWLPEILSLANNGLDFSLAMTLWALERRVPIRELPIRYHERKGQSKLSVVQDGQRFLWAILRSRFRGSVEPASLPPL